MHSAKIVLGQREQFGERRFDRHRPTAKYPVNVFVVHVDVLSSLRLTPARAATPAQSEEA